MISRRGILGAAVATVASLNSLRCQAVSRERLQNPLKIPALLEGAPESGQKIYELVVAAGRSEFLPDVSTPTLGINGAYLGPTIRCREKDRVTFRVKNDLVEPTTLHWHGLRVPAKSDGGPHQIIQPGGFWESSFEIKQNASLCWYHSHLMGRTGEQVLMGLAGLFLIDDDESNSLRLPSEYGVDDIPLIIQDRRFKPNGSFEYLSSMHDTMMGFKGDFILVNGTFNSYFVVRRQRTRFRILNGSNSRIYTLGRADDADLVVIGSDGSLLERPVWQRRVRLGPGERVELQIDMQANQTLRLMSYPDRVNTRAMGQGNTQTFPIIELRAGELETSDLSLPARLIRVPGWDPSRAFRTRTVTLDMGRRTMDGMMGINGRAMNMSRIDLEIPAGSVEIWEIKNATPLTHPFHIHGVQFRVIDRDGNPPLPQEQGLKDTVLIDQGSTVRIIVQFSDFADPVHPYMYHCHNLEHEDAGMMGQFVLV